MLAVTRITSYVIDSLTLLQTTRDDVYTHSLGDRWGRGAYYITSM